MARASTGRLACLLVAHFLFVSSVHAQATAATLKGRVTDSNQKAIPNAVVTLSSRTQPAAGRHTVTDRQGAYRFALLPAGNDYLLHVALRGFASVEVGPLDLDGGRTVVQNITVRSEEEATETLVVESQGGMVDTESTRTSTSYNAEFIEGLPIIGHNYQDILTLAPGVTDTDGDGNPNVHGARDTGLQYRLDGGNITDPVTGTYGQNLNIEMIEELEIITSGASAEYGRADGGFANIISKSGGNDFEGSFKIYWRGKLLDGNGAGNNDVAVSRETGYYKPDYASFHDLRATLTLGGAIVRDHLWYFGTVENLNTETPQNFGGGATLVTTRGSYSFAKLTWQENAFNKLALEYTSDPRTFHGLGLRLGVAPESDYSYRQGTIVPQLKWTATISPALLLESTLTGYHSRSQVRPVSPLWRPTTVTLIALSDGTVQAEYPCDISNCSAARGEHDIYQVDQYTGTVSGPYWLKQDQRSDRNSLKADLSYSVEDVWGQHSIKSGFEFQVEGYRDEPVNNPILYDGTRPYRPLSIGEPAESADERIQGVQVLVAFQPLVTPRNVSSFNSGAYLTDSWRPKPNVTINLGLRVDREDVDSSGYTFFDPRAERRAAVRLWRSICGAADRLDQATEEFGLVTKQNCYQYSSRAAEFDGKPPQFGERLPLDHPAWPITDPAIRRLDLDGDGVLTTAGPEGDGLLSPLTSYRERETANFAVANTNLAPRISLSWDPLSDGRMKTFATWGRFYDRLFLSTVAQEYGPDRFSYAFAPDKYHTIRSGFISNAASRISITQTDRGLRTPRTDEMSIGFERELAPEWSIGLTYVRRNGVDLLQDVDLNHLTCTQQGLIDVNPRAICWDGLRLNTDRFGDVGGSIAVRTSSSDGGYSTVGGDPGFNAAAVGGRLLPNGAPDLYTVNYNFNQILRITNSNSYKYNSWELRLVKRLHRNWQMQASYTWSEAFGQAETFVSGLGNDPQTKDDEEGYLAYDQRHVLKFQAVTRLPHGINLGGTIQWASGTPWSVIRGVSEFDSTGNIVVRDFYPSGQRNDQRNGGIWNLNSRVEKSFSFGRVDSSAFLNAENLLNSDDLTIQQVNASVAGGNSAQSYRQFGRRFELGASFKF